MPPRTHAAWRGLWKAGDQPGCSAGSPGPSGRGKCPLLLLEGPSRLPLLISLASLLCPQDPHGLEGALDCRELAWELSRLPMPQWVGQLPSTPLSPVFPDLPGLPPMPPGPTRPGGDFGLQGTGLGAQQAPRAPVSRAIALRSSPMPPGESLPPASPDLPSLRGADLVWPPLLLPPFFPYVLPVHSGVPPLSLGIRVPTSSRQAP